MKRYPNTLLMLALSVMVASCEKDTEGDGLTCADLTDDTMIVDGKAFLPNETRITMCAETNIYGGTWLTSRRPMIHGSGTDSNTPEVAVTLSSLPPVGQTTTYVVDNGQPWMLFEPPIEGRATVRVTDYSASNGWPEDWWCNSESGTVDVTVDNDGTVTYNFSVILVKATSDPDPKIFCVKNMVCK